MAEGFAELGWEVLRLDGAPASALAAVEVDFALAHPRFGVALVDLLTPHADPVGRLRGRLGAAGFSLAFPGYLPVIHRVLGLDDLWRLSLVLDPAFASEPAMEIAGGEWIAQLQRALLLQAVELPQVRDAPVEIPMDVPIDELAPNSPEPADALLERAGDAELPEQPVIEAARVEPPGGDPPTDAVLEAAPAAEASIPQVAAPPRDAPLVFAAKAGAALPGRQRPAPWFLGAAAVAAAIGLSHQVTPSEAWTSRLLLHGTEAGPGLRDSPAAVSSRMAEPGASGPDATALAATSFPEVLAIPEALPAAALPTATEPLPETEANLLRPRAVPPAPREPAMPAQPDPPVVATAVPRPPAALPPLESVFLASPQVAVAQPPPEVDLTTIRIAEARRPDFLLPTVAAIPALPVGPPVPEPLPEGPASEPAMAQIEQVTHLAAPELSPVPQIAGDRTSMPSPETLVRATPGEGTPVSASPEPETPVRAMPGPGPEPVTATLVPGTPVRPMPAQPSLPGGVIDMLIARGNEMLARGDISAARLFYARAAAAGSAAAARAMGRSFDPDVLNSLGVRGIRPDPEQARQWYQRAEEVR